MVSGYKGFCELSVFVNISATSPSAAIADLP